MTGRMLFLGREPRHWKIVIFGREPGYWQIFIFGKRATGTDRFLFWEESLGTGRLVRLTAQSLNFQSGTLSPLDSPFHQKNP